MDRAMKILLLYTEVSKIGEFVEVSDVLEDVELDFIRYLDGVLSVKFNDNVIRRVITNNPHADFIRLCHAVEKAVKQGKDTVFFDMLQSEAEVKKFLNDSEI